MKCFTRGTIFIFSQYHKLAIMHGTEYQDTLEARNIFLIWNFGTLVLCKLMYSFCPYRARAAAAQRQARDAEGDFLID